MSADPASAPAPGAPAGTALPSDTTRMAVDVRRFPWIRPLAGDYAFNYANVAPFYAGDPRSPAAWQDAIERARSHPRNSDAVAAVIAAQQVRRNAPPAARQAAARLSDRATVAVVTGQQAGGFGGPLYTLLKAITALQLARRAAEQQRVTVVPIFWVDAEDHDWAEVAACTVLDASFHPRTITLSPPAGAGELPIASLTLDDRIERSLVELTEALAPTDFSSWTLGSLAAAYRPGIGMAEAFARWLESLLGPHGLVVFESSDPAAKPLVADVFAHELRSPGRTAALAAAAGDGLAARGHQPQVEPHVDSVSLFHLDGARLAVRRAGDAFVVGEVTYSMDELLHEAQQVPSRFSPNVLLRPVVQDALFPTICYVGGPSEVAYLGQLGRVYEHFGIPMPLVYPRATATLLDSAALRFLNRYAVPVEELQPQDESALNRLLETQLPESVEHALRQAEHHIRTGLEGLISAIPALDPTLAGAAKTTLAKMEHDLRNLHSKMIHAAKRRDDTLRRQFMRAQAQAFPLGHPQERTLAVVFFLNRYGPALVDRLLDDLPLDPGHHWIMTI